MCGVRKWWQARRTGSDAADDRHAVIKKAPCVECGNGGRLEELEAMQRMTGTL